MCNGQNHIQYYRLLKFRSIIEAANWVCDDALDGHMRVSELTISCQEAKGIGISAIQPCESMHGPVEYAMVLGANNGLLNDGTTE